MNDTSNYSKALLTQGFTVLNGIYTADELKQLIAIIDAADPGGTARW